MQVYFKNDLVGEVRVPSPHPGARSVRMEIFNDMEGPFSHEPYKGDLADLVRWIELPLDHMSVAIDHMAMYRDKHHVDHVLREYGVRQRDCEVIRSDQTQTMIYRWKIIRANIQLLEEIFDMDWFEPANGVADPEYYEARHRAMMGSLAIGSISAAHIAGGAITAGKMKLDLRAGAITIKT